MVIGDHEEAAIISAILGGLVAYFIQPWGIGGAKAIASGMLISGGLTFLIGRLGDENFTADTSAILGILVSGLLMLGTAI